MKVLLISDVHSNLPALEAILQDAGSFDLAVSAGDTVGYGPYPDQCVHMLRTLKFLSVRGNHDDVIVGLNLNIGWFNDDAQRAIIIQKDMLSVDSFEWLKALPLEIEVKLGDKNLVVYHGSPTHPLTSYIYEREANMISTHLLKQTGANILLLGHTHIPYVVRSCDGVILNPGSVGQPRDGNAKASYMILESESLEIQNRRIDYNIDITAEAIFKAGLPVNFAHRLYRGF